jgi:virulence-associated protein VagC
MAQIATAFWLEGSQAVRLPREFWFDGQEVRVERLGVLIVLSPISGPSVAPRDEPRRPQPNVTFAGFLGPRPIPHRSAAETLAEVRRLFAQAPANDNEPIARVETPVG